MLKDVFGYHLRSLLKHKSKDILLYISNLERELFSFFTVYHYPELKNE